MAASWTEHPYDPDIADIAGPEVQVRHVR